MPLCRRGVFLRHRGDIPADGIQFDPLLGNFGDEAVRLKALQAGCHPKQVIAQLSEGLLAHYAGKPLIDPYDVYQHLMDYWAETMQDDCYLIAADGWKAETSRILVRDKKGSISGLPA